MQLHPIETDRLILRPFASDDVDAVFQILSDREANTFLPWFPAQTREEAENHLRERWLLPVQNGTGYCRAICLKPDNRPIGYVHMDLTAPYDFGYGLLCEFWHRGIVTEACRAILEEIKSSGLPYITATHDANNPRSGAVMQKLGMTYRYSYHEQWQPKDIPVTFRIYQLDFAPDILTYAGYAEKYGSFIENI